MLQIGANDLDTQFGANTKVAEHLLSVAEWLVASLGVQSVAIIQLLRRTRTRHVDVEQFNASVDLANEQLRQLCKASDVFFLAPQRHERRHKCRPLSRRSTFECFGDAKIYFVDTWSNIGGYSEARASGNAKPRLADRTGRW